MGLQGSTTQELKTQFALLKQEILDLLETVAESNNGNFLNNKKALL